MPLPAGRKLPWPAGAYAALHAGEQRTPTRLVMRLGRGGGGACQAAKAVVGGQPRDRQGRGGLLDIDGLQLAICDAPVGLRSTRRRSAQRWPGPPGLTRVLWCAVCAAGQHRCLGGSGRQLKAGRPTYTLGCSPTGNPSLWGPPASSLPALCRRQCLQRHQLHLAGFRGGV